MQKGWREGNSFICEKIKLKLQMWWISIPLNEDWRFLAGDWTFKCSRQAGSKGRAPLFLVSKQNLNLSHWHIWCTKNRWKWNRIEKIHGYLLKLIIKNLMIWKFFSSKFGKFWYSFPWKILLLYRSKPYFSGSKFGENSRIKETLAITKILTLENDQEHRIYRSSTLATSTHVLSIN
jgi:hypothetical protein